MNKGEVDSGVHAFPLRTPSGAEDCIGLFLDIIDAGRLDLRKKATKIADQIGAFEIGRQALKCP